MEQPPTNDRHPFQNPDLPTEARLDNILALMTLDEKIACLSTLPHVPRLGIEGSNHAEGLHGLAMGEPGGWGGDAPIPTTTFPQAIGMAATWDPEAVRLAGAVEGFEARYIAQSGAYRRSQLVIRAPNADLGRDPRWGRTEECYGEDAYFNGTMAVALIRGLQGDHPTYWQTAALLKHFLANSNENGRESSSSDFDERLLREYYSLPFRMGIVEGGARAYMSAYNAVNGVPCTINPILRDITVEEWGNDGIICSDAHAMRLLVSHHKVFPDEAQAAAAAVRAGIGQFLEEHEQAVRSALEQRLLSESDIDRVLRGTFRVMIRLGLLDPPERVPYSSIGGGDPPWLSEKHRAAARAVTQKSIVLLKNDPALLPLDRGALRSVAVIGRWADSVLLDWYSGSPPYAISPLAGIRAKLGPQVAVGYADGTDIAAAAELARAADVAIVCAGNHPTGNAGWAQVELPSDGKEAVDRQSLALEAEELIRQVYAANPRTVVALISSFPFAITWTQEHIPAILHMAQNSQETGSALADVLFGDYNPAGRLVQTWPRSLEQLPPMMDYDIRHGRTYMYFRGEPLYPFGHGLSYTSFAYANLRASQPALGAEGAISVSVDVTNTGQRAGEEVVQMYVRHLGSAVERPIQELRGFRRIALEPGQTQTVTLPLSGAQLAYWDTARRCFSVERGQVQIRVGRSSADILLETTVSVT